MGPQDDPADRDVSAKDADQDGGGQRVRRRTAGTGEHAGGQVRVGGSFGFWGYRSPWVCPSEVW